MKRARCMVMVFLLAAAVSGQDEAVETALSHGNAALTEERPVDAERAYREVLLLQPFLLDAHRGLARSLAAQGRGGEAAQGLGAVGEGLLRAGRHAAAAEVLTEVTSWAPQSSHWHALLGRALALAQDPARAAHALRRAVDLGEGSVTTRLYLASALWDAGEVDAAEALYRALVDETSAFLPIWQLGRLLRWRGDMEGAVVMLRRARRMRPQAADVTVELAAALGGTPEALAAWRRAVASAPDDRGARYGLARSLARAGEHEAAREEMAIYQRLYAEEQERTRREGLLRARLDRGWELLERGELAASRDHFSDLLEESGEGAETFAGLAQAHAALGAHGEAVRILERAVRLAPEREDLRRLLEAERTAASSTP